jgi:hypothetical protein
LIVPGKMDIGQDWRVLWMEIIECKLYIYIYIFTPNQEQLRRMELYRTLRLLAGIEPVPRDI